jgi:integrase
MSRELPCLLCARAVVLSPSQQRRLTITCPSCCAERRVSALLDPHVLAERIQQPWARKLIERYAQHLVDVGHGAEGRGRLVTHAVALGAIMGRQLSGEHQVSTSWLATAQRHHGRVLLPSFARFLRHEGVLHEMSADARQRQAIVEGVARIPLFFRRGVDEYISFRLDVHDEQRRRQLARALSLRTIATDVGELCRFAGHLERRHPEVTSWALVTETEVVGYLLDLRVGPNSRNIQRWGLHSFFAFAVRCRFVTHNPVPSEPGHEAPIDVQPLAVAEQAALVRCWSSDDDPLAALVGCLALLHGLRSGDLRGLRLTDVSLDERHLVVPGRPDVVLDAVTQRALQAYLAIRPVGPASSGNPHLIVNDYSRFTRSPVSRNFLKQLMRPYGVTPAGLRASCLVTVAQENGPRLLIDGFGLSATQAGRYQRFLAYRAEQAMARQART